MGNLVHSKKRQIAERRSLPTRDGWQAAAEAALAQWSRATGSGMLTIPGSISSRRKDLCATSGFRLSIMPFHPFRPGTASAVSSAGAGSALGQ